MSSSGLLSAWSVAPLIALITNSRTRPVKTNRDFPDAFLFDSSAKERVNDLLLSTIHAYVRVKRNSADVGSLDT